METKHTPTPWKRGYYPDDIETSGGTTIALVPRAIGKVYRISHDISAEPDANAAFIVRACNAHDSLVEAAQLALELIKGHWPYEHGNPHVATVWGALEKAIAAANDNAPAAREVAS